MKAIIQSFRCILFNKSLVLVVLSILVLNCLGELDAQSKANEPPKDIVSQPVILASDTIFSLKEKLLGHTSSTESMAISPDGNWLATGGWDRKILLYSIDSMGAIRYVKTFTGHNGAVTCLNFDDSSKMLASGSKDFSLRVVDVQTGTLLFQTMDHKDALTAIEFESSGKFVITSSLDKTLRLYDIVNPTNNQKPRFIDYGQPINDFLPSSNGKSFFIANNANNTVEVVDFSNKVLQTLAGSHTMPVNTLGLSNNRRMLATGGMDKSIVIWDLATNMPLKILLGHTWKVNSVSFSKNDNYLISTANDGEIRVWDVNAGNCITVQKSLISVAKGALFTPDMRQMIVVGKMAAQGATYGAVVYLAPPIWQKVKPVKSVTSPKVRRVSPRR